MGGIAAGEGEAVLGGAADDELIGAGKTGEAVLAEAVFEVLEAFGRGEELHGALGADLGDAGDDEGTALLAGGAIGGKDGEETVDLGGFAGAAFAAREGRRIGGGFLAVADDEAVGGGVLDDGKATAAEEVGGGEGVDGIAKDDDVAVAEAGEGGGAFREDLILGAEGVEGGGDGGDTADDAEVGDVGGGAHGEGGAVGEGVGLAVEGLDFGGSGEDGEVAIGRETAGADEHVEIGGDADENVGLGGGEGAPGFLEDGIGGLRGGGGGPEQAHGEGTEQEREGGDAEGPGGRSGNDCCGLGLGLGGRFNGQSLIVKTEDGDVGTFGKFDADLAGGEFAGIDFVEFVAELEGSAADGGVRCG